jgi:hypothetical protein
LDLLVDLLFPPTDGLVFAEVIVVVPLLALLVWRTWDRGKDVRLFTIGLLVFVIAFMAARTLH